MLRKLKKIFVVGLVTYLFIELVCFIFIKTKFRAAHFPQFSFEYDYKRYDFPIAEIDPGWGTWHYKEPYTETKQCFKSTFNINSFGARDKERVQHTDSNRVIFLGDSFIEGYGLNESERLSNRLEQLTKKEMLNFGCGYFTPTQEYLLYKNLASDFSHNTVIIGILPFNDLREDDTAYRERDPFVHYRPYFQGNYPNYKLLYKEDRLSMSTFNKAGYYALQNNAKARSTRFLKEFSFWYNIFQFIKISKPVLNKTEQPYSGYYDCSNSELDKLCFILRQLKQAAPGKRIIVLAIPVYSDFLRYKNDREPTFSRRMNQFCKKEQLEYVDLLPMLKSRVNDPRQLYFTCDGHWNSVANKMAAEIILPLLGK